jgi:hypothetical protein
MYPENLNTHAICILLFRVRKELGFSEAVPFRFIITGREMGGRGRRRAHHKARPIYLPLLFHRQQLELICDHSSCLTGTGKEPQRPCREE